jgi:hypothetical protein
LLAAITTIRAEHVAREALGMQARQHGRLIGDIAHHEREMFGAAFAHAKHVRGERAVARGKRGGGVENDALAVDGAVCCGRWIVRREHGVGQYC